MADFSTESEFVAVVDQASLREARSTVEDELGDIEVQVTAQTSSGGGGSMAARDRALGRRLQDKQLDVLTDIQTGLDEQGVSEELGNNWDESLTLDVRRNELLEALVESSEQSTFNRAVSGGGGILAGGTMLAGIAAVGLGSGLISFLSDFEFEPPNIPPIDIPKPDWTPLGVEEPDIVPVEEPNPLTVTEPDWWPLELPKPDWLPLDQPSGGGTGTGSPTGGGFTVPEEFRSDELYSAPTPTPAPTGGGGGVGMPSPEQVGGGILAGGAAGILHRLLGSGGGVGSGSPGGVVPSIAPILAEHGPEIFGFADPAPGAAATGVASRAMQQSGEQAHKTENNVTVNYTSENRIEAGDLDQLRREQEADRRELEREINQLKQQFAGGSVM